MLFHSRPANALKYFLCGNLRAILLKVIKLVTAVLRKEKLQWKSVTFPTKVTYFF